MLSIGQSTNFIGLDIGATHLAAVRLRNGEAVRVGEYPLALGVVDDGQVQDVDSLGESLRAFWEEERFKTRRVHIAIGSPRMSVSTIRVPHIENPDELRQAISLNISDRIHYDLEEAVIDYAPIGLEEADGRSYVVAVAPRDLVMEYVHALRRARLDPLAIQLVPFALLQSVRLETQEYAQDSLSIICHLGASINSIGIVKGEDCLFARFSTVAGATITEQVEKATGLPAAEAERIKCALGVDADPADERERTAQAAIMESVDNIGQAIHETFTYYRDQEDALSLPLSQVVLSGGGAYLRGLPAYLSTIMDKDVRIAEPAAGLKIHDEEYYGHWALPYGLARTHKLIESSQSKKKPRRSSARQKTASLPAEPPPLSVPGGSE